MNIEYKKIIERYNPWLFNGGDYCLMMPDDVDGLVSAAIMQRIFGYKINYFYDFLGLYCNELSFLCPESIGVDLALVRGKTICNHVSRISDKDSFNSEAVNLNIIDSVTVQNYTKKYAGSTALFFYSLFRNELKLKETPLLRAILLCIDSYFLGYKPEFRERQKYYLCDVLELPEIYEIQKNYSFSDFEKTQKVLRMKEKIRLEDGRLNINENHYQELLSYLSLELLTINNDFYQIEQYQKTVVPYEYILTVDKSGFSTFSCTYKRSGIATEYINQQKKIAS